MRKTVDKVFKKLSEMSSQELQIELEKCKDSNITRSVLELWNFRYQIYLQELLSVWGPT